MTSILYSHDVQDHRGLRTAKRVGAQTTYYLYDTGRQLQAELNGQGQLQRQYLYVADMALMVIDTPQGQALSAAQASITEQTLTALQDMGTAVQSWVSVEAGAGELTWLHTNHLGAPEAATNRQGQLVWQARYEAFGAAHVNEGHVKDGKNLPAHPFTLNLRLPGQYFDAETGLHYNRQRYYDPHAGQYLTPDPLGQPDGPNPYAYVAFNPLSNIDPDGLILFAFDGTGNSNDLNDPAMTGSSISNVWEFREKYLDGPRRYVTGVGTVHKDTEQNGGDIVPDDYAKGKLLDYLTGSDPLYLNDMGGNYSGPARIERMMLYMSQEAKAFDKTQTMDIDIIGFSRGAAEARDFANRIVTQTETVNGKTYYKYEGDDGKFACQWVNFRFMGLWDSVLSTNLSGTSYKLSIPSQFAYVAQAVALNEFRSSNVLSYGDRSPLPHSQHWGGFPLESIGASSSSPGATRIEMGFLGAHADIGGGFGDNALSKIALAWMLEQATTAGVKMDESPISIASSVVLHDKSNNIQTGKPVETCGLCTGGEDRKVSGAVSGTTQRTVGFGASSSMAYADTGQFITYQDRNTLARYTVEDVWNEKTGTGIRGVRGYMVGGIKADVTGEVNVDGYVAWLKLNGYDLSLLKVQ